MYGYFSPLYWIFALPALLYGMYAQYKVNAAYSKYSRVRNARNVTGLDAAQRLLAVAGLSHVHVGQTSGQLTDHYDPRSKQLALSQGVADVPSVAALGVVAHEVGHAVQDAEGYRPLRWRGALVPAVQVGSWVGPLLFIIGLALNLGRLPEIGLLLYSLTLVFALVTLPVERNASRRAVVLLEQSGLIQSAEEKAGVQSVLSAAALTYVALAVQALSTLLYYVTLLGGRRRD